MKRIFLAVSIITLFAVTHVFARDVDLQQLVQETQRLNQTTNSFQFVWWIPSEYWEESFRNAPDLTDSQKETFYRAVDDYIVISVIDAKIADIGTIISSSRNEIKNHLSVSIGKGKKIKPLADTQISSDATNLFAMMKPLLASMLGQFGQGMEFVCFNGMDPNGVRILDPKGSVSFSAQLHDTTFNWRLPLGSLLPIKHDMQTGEKFPGNYIYNPFTGNKLITKE